MDAEPTKDFQPRAYQAQLEEIAIKKNTIIHLPTGSGKTYIAIRLIKWFREDLQKPWGCGGKRTFFLVNTVPLVQQQKKVIENMTPVKGVGGYSGEDKVDLWDKRKWDAELAVNQVIVMTTQILSDMLTHCYIRIEDINLIIFDECHHAVVDHPMRLVMKHFEICPVDKQPRVLGLTATLLNANVPINRIENSLRELETTFNATIATVNELGEVLNFSTNPNEMVLYHKKYNLSSGASKAINKLEELQVLVLAVNLPCITSHQVRLRRDQENISNDPKKVVKKVNNMLVSMCTFIEEFGIYGGSLGILAYIIVLERLKRKAANKEEEQLYKFTITHCVQARMMLLDEMRNDHGYDKIMKYSSEKVKLLLNILKEYNPKIMFQPGVSFKVNRARKPLSAIIFTRQRFTAKVLYNLLKDIKEVNHDFDFLNHDFIVGFNENPFNTTREQQYLKKASRQALFKFVNQELNCLISTSVIEEGVDIRQCLLVLRFDKPLEYRSYIQSKGRARSSDSSYVILVEEDNKKAFHKQYDTFQLTEQHIQRMLVGNSEDREAPTQHEVQSQLYDEDNISPYVTEHGAYLSSVSAISLLGRYCSVLPHDQFTTITPLWIQEKVIDSKNVTPKRCVSIIMPISCPIKDEIKGDPMPNLKSAKRSAALNVCIKLHKAGELDEITLLPKPYTAVDFDDLEVKACFPNWPWTPENSDESEDVPKEGSKKRMRKHKLNFPIYLKCNQDQDTYYLHIIKMKTNFAPPTDSREKTLFGFLQLEEGYGFLTQKPLPKLCEFPMFTTIGEVKTSILPNYAVIKLDKKLFDVVKRFHFFMFDQILGVAKKFIFFEGIENCMYVVPTKYEDGYDIDWDIVLEQNSIPPLGVPDDQERRSLNVTVENYKHHIVTPWYRGTVLPDRYVVSNVLNHMTPNSRFSADSYSSFADYYAQKYNLEIMGDKNQPLLEVRNISTRMNCLLPRAATIKSLTEKQHRIISAAQGDDKPKGFPETFIAEFCIKYDFPGHLWYKATMLPSILHRVYMLLVAHELLTEISASTGYGNLQLSKTESWKPLDYNLQIVIKSLLSHLEDPTPISIVDRINNPVDTETSTIPITIGMKASLYQLQKKRLHMEYPWDEKMEPVDIERNISTATVMDIECYDKFVSMTIDHGEVKPTAKSPERVASAMSALSPPPFEYNDNIEILKKKPVGRGPELKDLLAALTTIKSHDTFNLERAETLGDSFLKYAASLYLCHKFPNLNEGQLTNIKCRLISNRNLYYAGARINLGGRMKIEQFSPRKDFLVPGFFAPRKVRKFIENKMIRPTFLINMQFPLSEMLSGKLSQDSWDTVERHYRECDGVAELEPVGKAQNAMQSYIQYQAVSDKSVADCVEALIGTYLLSGGISGAVKLLEWMRIIPEKDNLVEKFHLKVPTALSRNETTITDINFILNSTIQDVETILGYKFKDPSFLLEALSHPSYIRNRVTRSYERLEFLGDAILDFLITAYVFENCRELKPGEMTDLRSALVNNVTFAAYVVKLELHKYICCELNPTLDNAIMTFVEHQKQRDHEIQEDVLHLIDEEGCQIAQYVEVPKVLSDVFESLAGAMYLDSGGDLASVWRVYYRVMCREIDAFSQRVPQQPVKLLYEAIHACAVFEKSQVIDPDINKVMVPVRFTKNDSQHTVYGVGRNKSQAKRAAAKLALKILAL